MAELTIEEEMTEHLLQTFGYRVLRVDADSESKRPDFLAVLVFSTIAVAAAGGKSREARPSARTACWAARTPAQATTHDSGSPGMTNGAPTK